MALFLWSDQRNRMYFGECLKQRIVSSGFPVRASLLSTATPFFRKLDHHQIIESVARLAPPYSNWPTTDRRRRRAKGASQDARPSTGYGAPLTAHFNRKRSLSERSMANCGGRGRRRCGEVALVLPLLGGRHGRLWGRWSRAVAPQFTVTGENPPMQPAAPQGSIRDI